jgi:putative selenate reductase
MPATLEEREHLLAEGNSILELVSPIKVLAQEDNVCGLECVRNRLGEPQADGRREPLAIPGSEFTLQADSIIIATGQKPDLQFLNGSAVVKSSGKGVQVDERTGQTHVPGIYAGGDMVRGPATVIQACADGRRAAEAICRQLRVAFAPTVAPTAPPRADTSLLKIARSRLALPTLPQELPVAARSSFELVESTLSDSAARAEAERCLQCSLLCDKCVEVCPNRANLGYNCSPLIAVLPLYQCRQGQLTAEGEQVVRIEQTRQIIHLAELCNECGNCATFCVHDGKPFRDKPILYLTRNVFDSADTDGYYIGRAASGLSITRRHGGRLAQLITTEDGRLAFQNAHVRVTLHKPNLSVLQIELKQAFPGTLSLAEAVEMFAVLSGVSSSLPFLPLGPA